MAHAQKKSVETTSSEQFTPYIRPEQTIPELTAKSALVGITFAMIFGAVTTYLGLKVGLTVNASIPIAVLSIVILKTIGRSTILENNIVQCIGSAGEAVAGGVIFTIPAVIFLGHNMEYWKITMFALCGGWLGLLFMIPLRRALIVKEHGNLPYPEGTACADILIAGEKKGEMAKRVFQGLGFGLAYKILYGIFGFWKESVSWTSKKVFPGLTASAEMSPELVGIGYIIGPRSASIMVAGGVLAWMGLLPLIKFFGSYSPVAIHPSLVPIAEMSPPRIWTNYIRYIGAGAVVVGGFYNLIKAFPMIVSSFTGGIKSVTATRESGEAVSADIIRTERDMPTWLVFGGSAVIVIALWTMLNFAIHPGNPLSNLIAAVLMVAFGFFFVTVSCRVVGVIGTTSNPISGDTIATLMFTCLLFLAAGWTGGMYNVVALSVGAVICIAAANAGATSQDLKTGFLVGGTPRSQQVGLMLGVTFSAFVIGATLLFMNKTYRNFSPLTSLVTVGSEFISSGTAEYEGNDYRVAIVTDSKATTDLPAGRYLVDADGTAKVSFQEGIGGEKMPAPQARLMSLVIDGILSQKLPWGFIIMGGIIALTMILCGVTSVLAFAVGLYLPLSTTMPIFIGGMVNALVNMYRTRAAKREGGRLEDEGEAGAGSLFSSGLVAGGALSGILVAFVAYLNSKTGSSYEGIRDRLFNVGAGMFGWHVEGGEIESAGATVLTLVMGAVMAYLMFSIGKKKIAQS